jgi:hypothetical protein
MCRLILFQKEIPWRFNNKFFAGDQNTCTKNGDIDTQHLRCIGNNIIYTLISIKKRFSLFTSIFVTAVIRACTHLLSLGSDLILNKSFIFYIFDTMEQVFSVRTLGRYREMVTADVLQGLVHRSGRDWS